MVTIRPVAASDRPALFELVATFPTPTPPTAEAFDRAFTARLDDASSCVLVADGGDRLVGYIAGSCHQTFYAGGPAAWVDEILVVESRRSQGTGRLLMTAFEDWAIGRDCVLVGLATRGASGFYDAIGYATKAGYYKKYLTRPV